MDDMHIAREPVAVEECSALGPADLELHCSDGMVQAHSQLLYPSSTIFSELLQSTAERIIPVPDTTTKQWRLVKAWMQALLQSKPCPPVPLEEALDLLPVVHKYNFIGILPGLEKVITSEVSKDWTFEPGKPGYVLKWVAYADQWQLPRLLEVALAFVSTSRRGRSNYTRGVATAAVPAPVALLHEDYIHHALSFKALLRAGLLQDDLKSLSAPILYDVMQAALMGKGCPKCSGPGTYECMCQHPTASTGSLSSCFSCKTRYMCNKCSGYLDA